VSEFNRNAYLAAAARRPVQGAVHELTLPSGVIVKVRKTDASVWFLHHRLPQGLSLAAFNAFGTGEVEAGDERIDEKIEAVAQFMHDMIVAALVVPRIVPDELVPQNDELHYRELCEEDAAAIFSWATRREEAAPLEGFRRDTGVSAAGADGEEVRPAPQPPRRRRRPGIGA